jgi:methylthioribulose-1-phosphate dehydratase
MDFISAAGLIVETGRRLDARGLAPATAGNYSVRLDDGSIAVTVSGAHKGRLTADGVMRVDHLGRALDAKRPSAETLLHCLVYGLDAGAGAVLHTHSVWSTILSRADLAKGSLRIEGYEMLKGLEGIGTHDTAEEVPIFANAQDMTELSGRIRAAFSQSDWTRPGRPPGHGFLLSRHGLYTWGRDLAEARRHVEIFEFLFECVARSRLLGPGAVSATAEHR